MKLRNLIVLWVLFAAIMISCDSRQKLKIYNWTYYTPDSIIEKFEKEYNVRVIYDQFASNEEMYAKISRGRSGYDIVFPTGDYVEILIKQGMLEKIDHSRMTNLGNIDPEILIKTTYDPNMELSVPYYFGAAGVLVNTARVSDFENSWSIFEREDLRHRMVMLDSPREVIGGALAFLGYSVNSLERDQILAARDIIVNLWKPNLLRFDSDAFGKGYANGDFWVVYGFAEGIYEEIADNPRLINDTFFFIPEEGGPAYIDSMCILKGSANVELAHLFIDFIHRPEIYAEFVDAFDFPSTVNVPARELKTGASMYTVEDLSNTEPMNDVGTALEYYNNAWFNSIRVN